MNDVNQSTHKENVVHLLDTETNEIKEFTMKKSLLVFILVIVVGIGSGFIASFIIKQPSSMKNKAVNGSLSPVQQKAGIADTKTFKDTATGILKEGGIEGEGAYHLERPGGQSQNVYLTSTTVDLSIYIDRKVKVLGETYSAEKAGWLMDVGFIEVLQ